MFRRMKTRHQAETPKSGEPQKSYDGVSVSFSATAVVTMDTTTSKELPGAKNELTVTRPAQLPLTVYSMNRLSHVAEQKLLPAPRECTSDRVYTHVEATHNTGTSRSKINECILSDDIRQPDVDDVQELARKRRLTNLRAVKVEAQRRVNSRRARSPLGPNTSTQDLLGSTSTRPRRPKAQHASPRPTIINPDFPTSSAACEKLFGWLRSKGFSSWLIFNLAGSTGGCLFLEQMISNGHSEQAIDLVLQFAERERIDPFHVKCGTKSKV